MSDRIITQRLYRRKINLTGRVFGRLTVIRETVGIRTSSGIMVRRWECICKCGGHHIVRQGNLMRGNTVSCGCLKREGLHRTHGLVYTRTYRIWAGMKARCYFPAAKDFPYYGGRGIVVCHAWRSSFAVFLADMGECPGDQTLDRIDNDGPYCPFNCRYASRTDQANNCRTNHIVTFNGISLTLAQWSRSTGIPYTALIQRINRLGWSLDRAFTQPNGPAHHHR